MGIMLGFWCWRAEIPQKPQGLPCCEVWGSILHPLMLQKVGEALVCTGCMSVRLMWVGGSKFVKERAAEDEFVSWDETEYSKQESFEAEIGFISLSRGSCPSPPPS